MPFDIVVLNEEFKFIGEARLDPGVHGMLWRKIVNLDDYPNLGKAKEDKEDVIFAPEEVPALTQEVEKLEQYIAGDKLMSEDVKQKCLTFVRKLKELCLIAQKQKRSVDFVSGD
ncbi:MAG: hypothetical protein WA666_01585 [Nitrospirota bacterium]